MDNNSDQQSTTQQSQTPVQTPPPKNSLPPLETSPRKFFSKPVIFTLAGSFVLLTFVLISYLYITAANKSKQQIFLRPTTIPSPQLTQSSEVTTNWQTYKNTKNGYSIKFPKEGTIIEAVPENPKIYLDGLHLLLKEENELQKVTFVNQSNPNTCALRFQIKVLSNPNNLTLEQWAKPYKTTGNTVLDGNDAKTYETGDERIAPPGLWTVAAKGNYFYNVGSISDPFVDCFLKQKPIYNQILSTFKFSD